VTAALAWQCPLCNVTGLTQDADVATAATAAADALEHHLTDHHTDPEQQ
jgi:hypothetical protein